MAKRNILKLGDPILRKKTREVTEFDDNLAILLDDMLDTLNERKGAGLAAPQLGILKAACIIDVNEHFFEFINPKIIKYSTKLITHEEGCLSITGKSDECVYYPVERFDHVTVEAQNRYGEKFEVKLKGFAARAAQHEIDHLNGILFIDRVTDFELHKDKKKGSKK